MARYNPEFVTDKERLPDIARKVAAAMVIGLDLETTSFSPIDGNIRVLALNVEGDIFVIDVFKTGRPEPIIRVLNNPDGKVGSGHPVVVGQNLKFDQKFLLYEWGVELWPLFDTYRASSLIHNGRRMSHDLYALLRRELDEDSVTEHMGASDWTLPELTPEQRVYAAEDVFFLPFLRKSLRRKLFAHGLLRVALIEFEAIIAEAEMENNGFRIDRDMWLELAKKNKAKAAVLGDKLRRLLPHPHGQLSLPGMGSAFNIDSVPQLLASLGRLGVLELVFTDRGKVKWQPITNTRKNTLAMSATLFPEAQAVVDYRRYQKRCQSFGPAYLDNVNQKTGRVHTSYYPFTGAGRYACLAAGSPVKVSSARIADRKEVPIEDIRPGDMVWTHKGRWRRVVAALDMGVRRVFVVRFGNGDVLCCTGTHRFLSSEGVWISVRDMRSARRRDVTLFRGVGLPAVVVDAVTPSGSVRVYDLTVDQDASYQSGSVFSHNSSNPNLQQVPRDYEFRDCFRPVQGRKLVGCDYGQIELRLVAEHSGDSLLVSSYLDGMDIHELTGALMSGMSVGELRALKKSNPDAYALIRQSAKPVNFGFVYGLGAAKLVLYAKSNYGVNMTLEQAEKFRKRYFENYEGVRGWQERVLWEGERDRMSRTASGRLRYLEGERVHNEFFNSPIQGSAADGLKASLPIVYRKLRKYGDDARLVHMVHDEIIVEVKDDPDVIGGVEVDLEAGMVQGMRPFLKTVPVVAEPASGVSWAQIH